MFRIVKNLEKLELGRFQYNQKGRPGPSSKEVWVSRCNFVFDFDATITMPDGSSGWILTIRSKIAPRCVVFLTCHEATSTIILRKKLMNSGRGLIARLTSEDFFDLATSETGRLQNVKLTETCGKNLHDDAVYWVFRNAVFNRHGKRLEKSPILLLTQSSHSSVRNMADFPSVRHDPRTVLGALGKATRDYFGTHAVHALHVYSNALKTVLRDELLKREHMVSVANVSGPPNVGKTFACAIALSLLNCEKSHILSRCTASSLLDACHVSNNLLVVWDDPRDASHMQLCTIVHEAFHGHASSTIGKGARFYNSSIIIGTQRPMLGMPNVSANVPTLSRLSHVWMNDDASRDNADAAQRLAALMCDTPTVLPLLLGQTYSHSTADKLHDKLRKSCDHILDRALRIAAIDWCLCLQLNRLGLDWDERIIDDYFQRVYTDVLTTCASKVSHVETFVAHLKPLTTTLGFDVFKEKVMVDLRDGENVECVAVHLRDVAEHLRKLGKKCSAELIHKEVKGNPCIGEVNHNVNFRNPQTGLNVVRRALVIKKQYWDRLAPHESAHG